MARIPVPWATNREPAVSETAVGGKALEVDFAELARRTDPPLDALTLAVAAELGDVDSTAAREHLDALGAELAAELGPRAAPAEEAEACAGVLGARHGFVGDVERYDDPENSMLDRVLERRTGLPILLSVVYVEVARRAGVDLRGVGLPGHYVVGHFGAEPPILLDPFAGGGPLPEEPAPALVRPAGAHETVLRVLNNLVGSYERRGDLGREIRAAELRLALPLDSAIRSHLEAELRALRARLN